MNKALFYSLIAALIALTVSSAAIPLMKRIALALRAVDYPGGRRDQPGAIPRLGGVALVLGFFVAQGALAVLRWGDWKAQSTTAELVAIPLALFIVFVCGFLEDTIGLAPITRVVMQVTTALLVIKVGWSFGSIQLPFFGKLEFGILTGLISLIWIVGVTNAVNLLDGLDGLAGGVAAIIASSLLVFSIWYGDFLAAVVLGSIVGACLGFLRKNWAPAQIYLGDAGSLSLGFVLAIISIHSSIKAPTTIAILVPILVLGLPVIDTLLVMLFRLTHKSSGSRASLVKRAGGMFRADRNHLHYLMLRLVPNRSRIVIAIYLLAVAFCAMAFAAAISKNISLGFFLIVLEMLVIYTMRQLGLHADALKLSLAKRKEARELLLHGAGPVITKLKRSA